MNFLFDLCLITFCFFAVERSSYHPNSGSVIEGQIGSLGTYIQICGCIIPSNLEKLCLIIISTCREMYPKKRNVSNIIFTKTTEKTKSYYCSYDFSRLQQPVQNPISDNTNILWNSPSLGKNYSYRLPLVL